MIPAASSVELTERERQALDMLIAGDRYKKIGFKLGIHPKLVLKIVMSACDKFDTDSRVRAAVLYDRARR